LRAADECRILAFNRNTSCNLGVTKYDRYDPARLGCFGSGGDQTETLQLRWGKLTVNTLAFDVPADCKVSRVNVAISDKPMEASFSTRANRVVVDLIRPVTVETDQTLRIEISTNGNEHNQEA